MAKTIKDKVSASIRASKSSVFLRQDFDRFGDYRQVSRVVKELAETGTIVRMGYGVYAKARPSSISGRPVPTETLQNIGLQAMRKLGVRADIGKDLKALQSGASTQVPMAPVVSVGKSRITRKISFGNKNVLYEKG